MGDGFLVNGDENELARVIRRAIGVGDYETVRISTPQFERTNGVKVAYFPCTIEEFEDIQQAPHDVLIRLGLGVWDSDDTMTHYLYPGEWYGCIPDGMEVVDICGVSEPFRRDETDNDIRGGCLAYGFIRLRGAAAPKGDGGGG